MKQVRLLSVQTNSGFLENARVAFSPKLTCVIGARGTCKSTLVESIRFAFNSTKSRVDEITSPVGVITKTLGPAGSVRCEIAVHDEASTETFVIEREVGAEPRILRNGVRDSLSDDLLNEIEIYSQNSLQEIASEDHLDRRLELIDRPHRVKVNQIREEIEEHVRILQSLGPDLRGTRSEIEKRKSDVKALDSLRAELGASLTTRPELPPTLEEQHQSYLKRQRVLEKLQDLESLQKEATRFLAPARQLLDRVGNASRDLQELSYESKETIQTVNSFAQGLREVSEGLDTIKLIDFAKLYKVAFDEFEKANEDYYSQRQQQQAVNESLKREDQVRRRIAELEKSEKELKNYQHILEELQKKRRESRLQLTTLSEKLFELRVQEADRINSEFGDVIFLTVRRGAQSRLYINQLSSLLAGSRIRTQENIAAEIAIKLPPAELLDIIEMSDAQRLATIVDRDLAQVNRVLIYLRDHPDLYQLEDRPFDDVLDITMYDHGQSKPVESLSEGQKATALLPLILRGSSCPLIIDQPEDDLDNSFIFHVLVKNILRLKDTRQLIFVTHNANIPVLGDAEQIVVMHMEKPSKAGPPQFGTVEDCKLQILDLLEGGKEAFDKRERRYSGTK